MLGIAVLGSTGSIGRSTLDVISKHSRLYRVVSLAAKGSDAVMLKKQALDFKVQMIACDDARVAESLARDPELSGIEVIQGRDSAVRAALAEGVDIVVAAMSSTAGVRPVFEAVRMGRDVALANKEALVLGGGLLVSSALASGADIRPIDSEHSALYQAMGGRDPVGVDRVYITASGGPFREYTKAELNRVEPEQALNHPVWSMGPKVTVDSATLMNKGLEVIEARWLFGIPQERIHVLVHPEGVVHGMVQFEDGAIMAQMGPADMRVPIAYALSCPDRLDVGAERLDLASLGTLTFEEPDTEKFRCLELARQALKAGQGAVVALCAADEVAVDAFLEGRLGFLEIPELVERVLEDTPAVEPETLGHVLALLDEAKQRAEDILEGKGR